ncbi:hypothetical protein FRC19_007618 [Serendipita sp. 401]|nr:hypothetical protein FRC19_007618 [Serendipita sp. 401]
MFLARTFLSHSEQSLIKSLENIKFTPSSTTLIALHAPAPKLQPLFDQISKLPSKNIGCLSAPISSKHPISLSLLNIPSSIEHRVWRSIIPGTERAQVGRWYSREQIKRERNEGPMESSPDWNSDTARPPALPHALQGFVETKRQISGLLFFTDDAPQGLATSLNHYFPKTAKIGSIASSTPFITGRPFTIFESGSIYSDGAVGVAIAGTKASGIHPNFSSLRPIGIPLLTTRYVRPPVDKSSAKYGHSTASNIIYTMNDLPAADILAQLLGSRDNANVEDCPAIYLGVLDAQDKVDISVFPPFFTIFLTLWEDNSNFFCFGWFTVSRCFALRRRTLPNCWIKGPVLDFGTRHLGSFRHYHSPDDPRGLRY